MLPETQRFSAFDLKAANADAGDLLTFSRGYREKRGSFLLDIRASAVRALRRFILVFV